MRYRWSLCRMPHALCASSPLPPARLLRARATCSWGFQTPEGRPRPRLGRSESSVRRRPTKSKSKSPSAAFTEDPQGRSIAVGVGCCRCLWAHACASRACVRVCGGVCGALSVRAVSLHASIAWWMAWTTSGEGSLQRCSALGARVAGAIGWRGCRDVDVDVDGASRTLLSCARRRGSRTSAKLSTLPVRWLDVVVRSGRAYTAMLVRWLTLGCQLVWICVRAHSWHSESSK